MKKTFLFLTLLAAALLIAACQPQTIVETQVVEKVVTQEVEKEVVVTQEVEKEVIVTQEVEVPREQTVIRFSGWAANPQETALLESLLYRFSVENPDILVKYEPITGDYWQAINTMVATGEEPDVYYMDIFQYPAFAANEVLLPLDQFNPDVDAFIPSLIGAFTTDGVVYGIPKDFNTLGLFYNKDLFDQAGLEYPTDDWTWEDLKAAAEAISELGDDIYGLGVPADPGRFPIFVFQNGGSIMTDDFSDTLLDSPEAIEAAEFYTGFRADGSGATPDAVGEGWQGTAFGKGNFGMVYEGGWLIPYLAEQFPEINYGVVTPPAGPGGEGNLIFTVAYVISPNSENPEAAWRLIEFLTNEASQTTVLESGFALPTRVALQDSEYLANNEASAAIFRGSLEGARPFMWGLVGSDVNEQMAKALERIYLEGQSPAESLAQAAEAIRQAIADAQ